MTEPDVRGTPTAPMLARLVAQNVNSSWARSLPLVLTASLVVAGGLHAGPGALQRFLHHENDRRAAGSLIVTATSQHGLSAATCERLRQSSGVVEAGSFTIDGLRDIRPGSSASTVTMTTGMMRLAFDDRSVGGDGSAEIIGDGLADELFIARDSANEIVLPASGQRTERLSASVMRIGAPIGSAAECWVEMTPGAFARGADLLVAAFAVASSDLKVQTLAFDSGPRTFQQRSVDDAALAAGLLLGLIATIFVRLRRIDLAMYRLIGFSRLQTMLVVGAEMAAWVCAGCVSGATGWTIATVFDGRVTRPVLAAAVGTILTAFGVALVVIAADVVLLSRRSSQLTILREGS